MGIHQIRLHGIDAVEPKQPCDKEGQSKSYCHLSASEFLRSFTLQDNFRCEIHVRDGERKPWIRYGRYVATCYVGDDDVNEQLVAQGWAYADRYHGEVYKAAEASAIENGLGIHGTTDPQKPWEWRKSQREDSCSCE